MKGSNYNMKLGVCYMANLWHGSLMTAGKAERIRARICKRFWIPGIDSKE
jgi:hypothetical protein